MKEQCQATVPSSSSVVGREQLLDNARLQALDGHCSRLNNLLMNQPPKIDTFDISFGKEDLGIDGNIMVNISAMIDMLKDEWLDVSILHIFSIANARRCKLLSLSRFRFLDPYRCAAVNIDKEYAYLQNYFELNVQLNSFVFLPYIEGGHWMLLIVHLAESRCYIMDSLNPDEIPKLTVMGYLNTAFRNYWMKKGVIKKNGGKLSGILIKGPKQPGGSECGYYVMRMMHDIINTFSEATTLPPTIQPSEYSQSQLNEVRDMVAEFLVYEI